ncbi:hypothetical protein GCM10010387_26370 [Streptomyces inusitatus]|uniref:Uncharacterized protein n=1 Tax=Streptomyces inusitatus TaxID=68221 RepID=A0A918Q338_9ACTN|nr:hypothetical protein [Streptomyces inusitatus]GGZ31268.1 hypothetical protein GCM10010387_26370 [Streptomyces inusitatus]
MSPPQPPGKHPLDPAGAIIRSVASRMARRLAGRPLPVGALSSVMELTENDETEMAMDEIGRVIEYYRLPVLRAEYGELLLAAEQLDSLDSLTDTGVERFVVDG